MNKTFVSKGHLANVNPRQACKEIFGKSKGRQVFKFSIDTSTSKISLTGDMARTRGEKLESKEEGETRSDIETLQAENQRMKEELEQAKARAETYERTIHKLKKELEAYKREMEQNEELLEHSFVESKAMAKKNSLLCNKIKRLQHIVQKHF